jgi:hypothetical protein
MGEQFLFDYFGVPVVLWIVLYISDYFLTIWGAYLYARGASNHFHVEGSYELNPIFEKDINLLRLISPRFLIYLFGSTVLLLIMRGLTRDLPLFFIFGIGGFLLLESFVQLRHIRNIASLWSMSRDEGVTGRLDYARWFTYRTSAIDALSFAFFLLVVAVLVGSWFLVGGAFSCTVLAIRQGFRSRQLRKTITPQNG